MGQKMIADQPSIITAIKQYMRRYYVSQSELSERTGIPQPQISEYLTRKKSPSAKRIDRILAGLEVEAKLVLLPLPMPDLDNLDDWIESISPAMKARTPEPRHPRT
jgi:transcriptional regulator with XRE-family HTH domain